MEIKNTLERAVPVSLLAVGLGLVGLTGCGSSPEIEEGRPATVVEHHYRAPYTSVIIVGKVPVMQYHPADYDLTLQQCNRFGDEHADTQGCVEARIDVSEEVYNQYPDGSTIVIPREEE